MDKKLRCQSCGMPLGEFQTSENKIVNNYGSLEDGTKSQEYCRICYQNGQFTRPELTLKDMIRLSVENMMTDLRFPEEKANELAESVIPNLKRWRK